MPPIGRDVGEKLRLLAQQQRLTQGQVAQKAHLSQPTVSALFGGSIKDPPISTVLKAAQALGVTVDQVLGLTPLPMADQEPLADEDLRAQVAWLTKSVRQLLERGEADRLIVAAALEEEAREEQQPKREGSRRPSSSGRRAG